MSTRRSKTKAAARTTSGPTPPAKPTEIVIAPSQPPLDVPDTASGDREPSVEELRELEVSVLREQERENVLGLAKEYPRIDRPLIHPLADALKGIPGLKPARARVVAQSLKQIADRAHDLDEIIDRILHEKYDPGEIAELVMAFQIVTEQLCSYADIMEERLYELFDGAKGLK